MQELIQVTTGGQGQPVVAARELYEFLGLNKAAFARWAKKNIENNTFAREGEDWEGFNTMLSGNEVKDYALTLDFAKRLSMLARTEKGEQARRYFLDCEKKLNTPAVPSTEQVLIQLVAQSNQLLANQQEQLSQLRADMDNIMRGQRPATQRKQIARPTPHVVGPPKGTNPGNGLRQAINRKVIEYCGYHGAEQGATYNYLYRRMNEVYVINVYRLIRVGGESLLDALERYGHLDKLYSLIMAELTYVEE